MFSFRFLNYLTKNKKSMVITPNFVIKLLYISMHFNFSKNALLLYDRNYFDRNSDSIYSVYEYFNSKSKRILRSYEYRNVHLRHPFILPISTWNMAAYLSTKCGREYDVQVHRADWTYIFFYPCTGSIGWSNGKNGIIIIFFCSTCSMLVSCLKRKSKWKQEKSFYVFRSQFDALFMQSEFMPVEKCYLKLKSL